jgi:hypothetical protein
MSTAAHAPPDLRPKEVRQLAEQAVGPVATWTDASTDRDSSRVWRAEDGGASVHLGRQALGPQTSGLVGAVDQVLEQPGRHPLGGPSSGEMLSLPP